MKVSPNQRVKLVRTGGNMDGLEGTAIGVSADLPGMTVFIVELDSPYDNGYGDGWKAIAITEHCLEGI